MLKNAAQMLNFTYTIQNSPDGKWLGLKKDASWIGLMGQASKNIVDFSIGALPVEVGSTKVIFWIFNYIIIPYTIIKL